MVAGIGDDKVQVRWITAVGVLRPERITERDHVSSACAQNGGKIVAVLKFTGEFFGFLIAILGCYFGLETRGGTEGVGKATTTSVVVVSISILVADAILTQLFMSV